METLIQTKFGVGMESAELWQVMENKTKDVLKNGLVNTGPV